MVIREKMSPKKLGNLLSMFGKIKMDNG